MNWEEERLKSTARIVIGAKRLGVKRSFLRVSVKSPGRETKWTLGDGRLCPFSGSAGRGAYAKRYRVRRLDLKCARGSRP